MKELHDKNDVIDLTTVHDKVKSDEAFNSAGGVKYLLDLANFVSSAIYIEKHAMIVREKEVRRNIMNACFEIARSARNEALDIDEVIKDFLSKADASAGVFNESTDIVSMDDAIKVSLETFTSNQANLNKGTLTGVTTGSETIDKMIGRLQPGNLLIVAARPAMGKTAFALNIAESAATEGDNVVIVSLEMAPRELVNRLIIRNSAGIRSDVLKNVEATDEETMEIHRVAGKMQKLPKLKNRGKIDLLILDYLQLMSGSKSQNREQEISEISRAMKNLATELNIPVIALSQLNRALEARQDKRPMMSDLRESGAIEQDADMLFLLNRPAKYGIEKVETDGGREISSQGILMCDIAKQRNGATGEVMLMHNNTVTRIWDYDESGNNDFKDEPF